MRAREYWNRNLDTDNLGRRSVSDDEALRESMAFAASPEFRWVRRRLGRVEGCRIVDLGGGVGMHALLWARAGARVIVVDPAPARLERLRELAERAGVAERVQFVAGSAEALPLRADSVAIVFTKSVLIHTDLERAAREMHRVLEPGGRGAFIEPLNRNPLIRLYRGLFAPRIWRSITRYCDAESLDELRSAFGNLRWEPFYLVGAASFFWQYGWRNPRCFRRGLRRWMRVDRWLLRWRPSLGRWCWFAAIEVRKEPRSAVGPDYSASASSRQTSR